MLQMIDSEKEPKGLIHALKLDGKGGATTIAWREVLDVTPSQEHLWLHFDYDEPEAQQWIKDCSGLNEVAVDGLLSEGNRPHVLTRGENLLIILRGVNLNPGAEPEDMVSVRIWTNGRVLISTRKRILLSTGDLTSDLAEHVGPKDIAALLVSWIERIVRRTTDTVDLLEDDLLTVEDELFLGEPKDIRSALLRVRKQSIGIRRYIAPQREALNRLISEPLSWLNELDRLNLRSIAERQIRHIEDIDAVKERASMAHDELASKVADDLNQRSYVLTIVAAVFLPLGFFTGLMGINVGGMPGVEYKLAFWIVVGMCTGIMGLLLGLFYWRKWL
ncbi:zinc transporter ZntB [Shewanella sp. 125m-1]